MLNLDEDALICDFAETYNIYDYRSLPLKTAATLAYGLRDNSRIRMLNSGIRADMDTLLLAMIADRIELFRYMFAKHNKDDVPKSITALIYGIKDDGDKDETIGFNTPEEFKAEYERILKCQEQH